MEDQPQQLESADASLAGTEPAVEHLKQSLAEGKNWYVALLEAIKVWRKAEESFNGRTYRYLISGEAFDFLLLAERLCDAVPGMIPDDEKESLLLRGQPPISLSPDEFKRLIGPAKYHHYLNYFYGITAEEGLVLAVEEEVRKEKHAWGYTHESDVTNEAYRRIYGTTLSSLLRQFRKEAGRSQTKSIGLTELKEFAYWRFKYRLKVCEKARVASDSRKALSWLRTHGVTSYIQRRDTAEPFEPEQNARGSDQ